MGDWWKEHTSHLLTSNLNFLDVSYVSANSKNMLPVIYHLGLDLNVLPGVICFKDTVNQDLVIFDWCFGMQVYQIRREIIRSHRICEEWNVWIPRGRRVVVAFFLFFLRPVIDLDSRLLLLGFILHRGLFLLRLLRLSVNLFILTCLFLLVLKKELANFGLQYNTVIAALRCAHQQLHLSVYEGHTFTLDVDQHHSVGHHV